MEEIVKLIKDGVVQYPITKPEAVIDESGVSLNQKISLRNVSAVAIDEEVEEPNIPSVGGGMTTPSGDPMHYMFEAVGATFNSTDNDITMTGVYGDTYIHKAKHWCLNELGDITLEEMRDIYIRGNITNAVKGVSKFMDGYDGRTNIVTWSGSWSEKIKDAQIFGYNYNLINARFRNVTHYLDSNCNFMFAGASKVEKIFPTLNAVSTTSFTDAFSSCTRLKEVRIKELKTSINFQKSESLSNASILYMIQNEAATSAIIITLHADAYDRANADEEIQSALAAHPNVSLAKA